MHNETLSVAAMCVSDPDCLSVVHSGSRNAVSLSSAYTTTCRGDGKSDSSVTFSRAVHLTDGVYIIDMSLLIIAQLFLLRAIDSFKRSSRRASATKIVCP